MSSPQDAKSKYYVPEPFHWMANGCFILATILFLSPAIAAHSMAPWILYIVGNSVWLLDSWFAKKVAWIIMASFFMCWDIVLIISRTASVDILSFLQPLVHVLEKILL